MIPRKLDLTSYNNYAMEWKYDLLLTDIFQQKIAAHNLQMVIIQFIDDIIN
jgi:hypothetical protein